MIISTIRHNLQGIVCALLTIIDVIETLWYISAKIGIIQHTRFAQKARDRTLTKVTEGGGRKTNNKK